MSVEDKLDRSVLTVSSSPHIKDRTTVRGIMFDVVIALIPAIAAATYFFGSSALVTLGSCIAGAFAAEAGVMWARGKRIPLSDGSALVTGILLGLTMPPGVPIWLGFVGGAFGVGIGKAIFGGLGLNLFNPALVGRAFLVASFPVLMTTFRWPAESGSWMGANFDAVSTATPLALLRFAGTETPLMELFLGRVGGSLGETSALALLIGGAYLILRGVIDWKVPVSYIGMVMILSWIGGGSPLFHMMAGGLLLGAIFMATDYVTSPITPRGKLIFGLGCGLLTYAIRSYGGYPEGVLYSILLMNSTVPLIERFTRPRVFGTGVKADERA
ncbi:MAG: RnfABCDGE type electron transport complex subunit D [Bacillota bacterium]